MQFPDKKYNIIYADPPWRYSLHGDKKRVRYAENKEYMTFGQAYYDSMSTEDICKLPVDSISAATSMLFIWVTSPLLQDGLQIIKAWGFEYKTVAFVWIKSHRASSPLSGYRNFLEIGTYTRPASELCLLAARGTPTKLIRSHTVEQVLHAPIRGHSAKPAIIRDRIVNLVGDIPRIELFARQRIPGWDSWGDQIREDTTISQHFSTATVHQDHASTTL